MEKNNFLGTYFLLQKGIELIEIFLFMVCENETGKFNLDMVIVEELVTAIIIESNTHRKSIEAKLQMKLKSIKLQIVWTA